MMNKSSLNKLIKNKVKEILYYNFNWYKGKYLGIHLKGGLCNKLMCLISACDIAINEEAIIIEPIFGWNKKILFSDIYDLEYFNSQMGEFANGKPLMISRKESTEARIKKKSIENILDLWDYSENELSLQRKSHTIAENSTKLKVLKALRLKPEFTKIVDTYVGNAKFTAIQIRTESDWVKYSENNNVGNNEKILVPLKDILLMLKNFDFPGKLFYTSGENHDLITASFKEIEINSYYFFDPILEYEINAAINFEICCNSDYFIGLSRSSYSNLITLKRASILNNDNSFIYNYKNKICLRKDKGIQYDAELSINKKTKIL